MTREDVQKLYQVSNDYKQLKDLVMSGKEVVCFVTYTRELSSGSKYTFTDVCVMRYRHFEENDKYDTITAGCRGTQFIDYWPNNPLLTESFEEECEYYQLLYIEPNNE